MNGVKGGARCVKLQGDKGGATTGLTFQYKTLKALQETDGPYIKITQSVTH